MEISRPLSRVGMSKMCVAYGASQYVSGTEMVGGLVVGGGEKRQ